MTVPPSEAALRRWAEAVNAHDLDAIVAAITPDLHWKLWDAETRTAAESREAWKLLFEGIPDYRMEPVDVIANGAKAAARWRITGTHTGPLRFRGTKSMESPLPPTGKRFEVEAASLHEFRDGRMSVNRAFWRPDQMMAQLGIRP